MKEVELKIGKTQIKLSCEDQTKLLHLTEILNSKVISIKNLNHHISDTKAFIVIALHLIDEIEILNNDLKTLNINIEGQRANKQSTLGEEKDLILKEINDIAMLLENSNA